MLRAGELRLRGELLTPTFTAAGDGEQIADWTTVTAIPVRFGFLSQRATEALVQGRIEGRRTLGIQMRYRTGVDTSMRFSYASRTFDIRSVIDDGGRHERLVVEIEEVEA